MPAANELTESFNATQALVTEHEDRSLSFEAHIEARSGSISIVGLGALGYPVVEPTSDWRDSRGVRYQGRAIRRARRRIDNQHQLRFTRSLGR